MSFGPASFIMSGEKGAARTATGLERAAPNAPGRRWNGRKERGKRASEK